MKENLRNFNGAAKVFLVIAAFRMLLSSVTLILQMQIINMLGYSTGTHLLKILFSVLAIVAIVFTLMRKRWALIALLIIAATSFFATIQYASNFSLAYQFGSQSAEFAINYGLFLIAMCFKKDGLSGWVSMLASEEYVLAHKVKKED